MGKLGPIFGTGMGIYDILSNRSNHHTVQPDYAPEGRQGNRRAAVYAEGATGAKTPAATYGNRDGVKSRFSIQKLASELHVLEGLYRSNLYEVTIHVKQSHLNKYNNEKLKFLCNSAALPGVQILASDHRRQGFGTFDRRVFGAQVTDIPLTFMLDNTGFVLAFFQNWMNNIVYYSPEGEHSAQGHTGAQKFEVNYRNNYECQVEIATYDHSSNEIITYKLFEAFPFQMGDVTVAWAETDAFSLLPVQFTFRNYTTSRTIADNASSGRSSDLDQYLGGTKGYTVTQTGLATTART